MVRIENERTGKDLEWRIHGRRKVRRLVVVVRAKKEQVLVFQIDFWCLGMIDVIRGIMQLLEGLADRVLLILPGSRNQDSSYN